MANAKKCDRCGKFYVSDFKTCVSLTTYDNMQRAVGFDCGLLPDLDLCPDCVESFKQWWANETAIPIIKKEGEKDDT